LDDTGFYIDNTSLLERLEKLINEYDTEAVELIDDIQSTPLIKTYESRVKQLINSVKSFDFEKALLQIKELRAQSERH
jgi:hypothetical protein